MRHLELHIIQSVPVACLNRDDLGSPKTAFFGGVQRARVSSQSWKRAIRTLAKEILPSRFQGERTKFMVNPLKDIFINEHGFTPELALKVAKKIVGEIVKLDEKNVEKKEKGITSTLYFTSNNELKALAKAYKDSTKSKDDEKIKEAIKSININNINDAADIYIFGRMVANHHDLTIEAASMFSHALSTHKVENEIDFFSAIDDRQGLDDSASDEVTGAAMIGTLEFNSATYYRFAALNLDMLTEYLKTLSQEERVEIVKTFIEATIKAMPIARKNSMNANTLPNYVLGIVREEGHPVQLINAFENPIYSKAGIAAKSIEALQKEDTKLTEDWNLKHSLKVAVSEVGLAEFLNKVGEHVR